jgi:hypothetical protein
MGVISAVDVSTITLVVEGGNTISPASPFTFGTGDAVIISGTYERA